MRTPRTTLAELRQLLDSEAQDDPKTAGMPEFSEVLYSKPMPGGARRNCHNCVFWVKPHSQCSLMEPGVLATAKHVCGHHIPGAPVQTRMELPGLSPMDPQYAGLVLASKGIACENCDHYTVQEEDEGVCAAVVKNGAPTSSRRSPPVQAKACCTRWSPRRTPGDPKEKP